MTTFTHIKYNDNGNIIENQVYNVLEMNGNGIMKYAIMKYAIEKCLQRRHIKFDENGDIIENCVYNVLKTNKNNKIIR